MFSLLWRVSWKHRPDFCSMTLQISLKRKFCRNYCRVLQPNPAHAGFCVAGATHVDGQAVVKAIKYKAVRCWKNSVLTETDWGPTQKRSRRPLPTTPTISPRAAQLYVPPLEINQINKSLFQHIMNEKYQPK